VVYFSHHFLDNSLQPKILRVKELKLLQKERAVGKHDRHWVLSIGKHWRCRISTKRKLCISQHKNLRMPSKAQKILVRGLTHLGLMQRITYGKTQSFLLETPIL
jgi:hypothetical protein